MATRSRAWLRIYARALSQLASRRRAPAGNVPARVLLPHHSRLGDTILLTAAVAKLRERYPRAQIVHVMPEAFVPLFQGHPYGVQAVGWNPADPRTVDRLFELEPFDLALINGDSRFSWLAAAIGTRRIVAFAGDRPAYKSWPVDEAVPMPQRAMSWSDLVAELVPGDAPAPYARGAWAAPDCAPFDRVAREYAVLHVGASHVHKTWDSAKWAALASALQARGLAVAWSAGPGEEHLVEAIPGFERHRSYAGILSIEQLWHLLEGASLVVAPDTSALHLARAAFAPTLALFGPSGPTLGGRGSFWRNCPAQELAIDPFECRDQTDLFKRKVAWVRRCSRGPSECARARCMDALTLELALPAVDALLAAPVRHPGHAVTLQRRTN